LRRVQPQGHPSLTAFAMLRFYSPKQALLDHTWILPDIKKA